jgi:NAD(P)-dependent dehydrogenase (short-subunit alcohol dehydrogenase family)
VSADDLEGRVALVTGSSRGIGRATAVALASRGARVILTARGREDLEAATEEAARAGPSPRGEECDFEDPAQIESLFDRLKADRIAIDILVNNVGLARMARFDEVPDEEWHRDWELNVMSAVRCCRRVIPGMRRAGWGRIVNVASSAAKRPSARWPHYATTKAALLGLTMTLADAYGRDGITVNAICPGPVASSLWTGEGGFADRIAEERGVTRESVLEEVGKGIPLGRMGEPEEIAAAIAFLCTDAARFVHGAAFSVDGGNVRIIV